MKKYMIVPYVEQKPITYKDKIVSILKNKSISREAKIKLINNIISNLNKNEQFQLSTLFEDIKSQIPENLDWFYEGFNIDDPIVDNTNTEKIPPQVIDLNDALPQEITDENITEEPIITVEESIRQPRTRSKVTLATPWRNTPNRKTKRLLSYSIVQKDNRKSKKRKKSIEPSDVRSKRKKTNNLQKYINTKAAVSIKKAIQIANNLKPELFKIKNNSNNLNQTIIEPMETEIQNESGRWQKY